MIADVLPLCASSDPASVEEALRPQLHSISNYQIRFQSASRLQSPSVLFRPRPASASIGFLPQSALRLIRIPPNRLYASFAFHRCQSHRQSHSTDANRTANRLSATISVATASFAIPFTDLMSVNYSTKHQKVSQAKETNRPASCSFFASYILPKGFYVTRVTFASSLASLHELTYQMEPNF
jgi:hypothetical protein